MNFPDSPSVGTQFLPTSMGILYLYDNSGSWTGIGDTQTTNPFRNSFRYRTIYTRGYVSAGYRNSTPWRNVNRTVHSTDVSTNLGDILTYSSSYIDGGWSDYVHFIYGNSGGVGGSSTYTDAVNMATDTQKSYNSAWNTKTSRGDCVVLMNAGLTMAYITAGGSAATDKHNMITEVMFAAGSAPNNPYSGGGTGGGLASMFGEFRGWIGTSSSGAYLTWSNDTWTSAGWVTDADGQPKGLSSKLGFGYCAQGSYAGSATYRKFNDFNGGSAVANISRPDSCGEENHEVGQNWGYSLGSYNGAQTNNTQKINYLNDTSIAMGSDTQPKGHDGMSSGCCGTASSFLLGGQ